MSRLQIAIDMNYLKGFVALGAWLLLTHAPVRAIPIAPDAVTNQKITRPLNIATADDYLIDMARVADVNFIADATDFPAPAPVTAYPSMPGSIAGLKGEYREHWDARLINVMGDFAAQAKLSTLRPDERTFLFWSEPDPEQLATLQLSLIRTVEQDRFAKASAALQAQGVPPEEVVNGETTPEALRTVLFELLQTQRGWTRNTAALDKNIDIRFALAELPPDVRARILLDLREIVVKPRDSLALNADFWKNPRLRARVFDFNGTDVIGVQLPALPVKDENEKNKGDEQIEAEFVLSKLNASNAPTALQMSAEPISQIAPLAPDFGEANEETLDNVYSGLSDDLINSQLDSDAALQRAVSLQVKRLPLRELLAQLQTQSGVTLRLGTDAPADKLLTARVEAMPLAKWMESLARVYGVSWSKVGDAYSMQGNTRGELHLKLLQMGEPRRYRVRFEFYNRSDREQENAALGRAAIEQVGLDALKTPQGVPFSSLTPVLQDRWRQAIAVPVAEDVSRALFKFQPLLNQELAQNGLSLQFANGFGEPRTPSGDAIHNYTMMGYTAPLPSLNFAILSQDNKMSALVFPESIILILPSDLTAPAPHAPSRRR